MDYPRYRDWGCRSQRPVESTIKQVNRRIKGSEKFWLQGGAEAVLQVRAAYLSEDGRAERILGRPRPHPRAVGRRRLPGPPPRRNDGMDPQRLVEYLLHVIVDDAGTGEYFNHLGLLEFFAESSLLRTVTPARFGYLRSIAALNATSGRRRKL